MRPSCKDLPAPLARAAHSVAEVLARTGRRGWIVGGTVRDLARGRVPEDVDMASAATPEEIERLFPRTVPVGRAFGTMIVVTPTADIELTTFRSEAGYRDARRPDSVQYGTSVEEDAKRRDFTCNALYLDPLTDELLDPEGGVADLEQRRLRCVGEAALRFAEDGLRLMRMARFEAALDLEPAPGLHEAARSARDSLRGVSPERVRRELVRIFEEARSERAFGVLESCGILERALPSWYESSSGSRPQETVFAARQRVFGMLPQPLGAELGLAVLLEVDPLGPGGEAAVDAGRSLGEALRLSREERNACVALWLSRRAFATLVLSGATRAARIRALREPWGRTGLALARAWALAAGARSEAYEALEAWARGLGSEDLAPQPWIRAADLRAAEVPPGPRWKELLTEAEDRQLEGELATREAALAWLAARTRSG